MTIDSEVAVLADKQITINMPQMAVEALSENWFFKELGDTHWEMLCKGLGTKSFDLKNDMGSRLYATFVRIRFNCSGTLKSFKENQQVRLTGDMNRFGNSMYFSNLLFQSDTAHIDAELMTTFSIRDKVDNTKLAKSEPYGVVNTIANSPQFPTIGNEYRLVKKQVMKKLAYKDYEFNVSDEVMYEKEYTLNPFYDINGVNLLYFAAYPIINDFCEAAYFNEKKELEDRWEQTYFTKYKDVFYYANCNHTDSLIYQLVDCTTLSDGSKQLSSILRRKSDHAIIARIFTVKSKHEPLA